MKTLIHPESDHIFPCFPVILDRNGELIPLKDESEISILLKSVRLTAMREYLLIDCLGKSWCLIAYPRKKYDIFANDLIPNLTKKRLVNGFNNRKNKILDTQYKRKITNRIFKEIFLEIFSLLEEEKNHSSDKAKL